MKTITVFFNDGVIIIKSRFAVQIARRWFQQPDAWAVMIDHADGSTTYKLKDA